MSDPFGGIAGVLAAEPLAKHSQFGVGGPAQWFAQVADEAALRALVLRARDSGVPLTMLGAGSNTLILDGGVRGLVVRYDDRSFTASDGVVMLGGGCMMPRAALDCARRGLAGVEFGIGVPGTCGASVYGNAGAFGAEIADVLVDCDAMAPDGEVQTLDNAACRFAYRFSAFKNSFAGNVVIRARFRVTPDDAASVRRRTDDIQRQRKASQPYGIRSLGSVFKNPPGDAAGRIIEACGLKGMRWGGAQIAEKHANFIVNVERATAADVLELVRRAHDKVAERFGVDLEREIVVVGEPALSATGIA
ncbi:MAG: UDP-N-acetylmuramate dehydrogenase [Candidatus Dormibacteraeota bacterium]|nr:UDP-N-acetylmuramate dehydrogenase [Candidatus Dormibacteraeota bacterium]